MALFENYERRIDKINSVLNNMVFHQSKNAKKSLFLRALTLIKSYVKLSQSALKMQFGLTQ